MIYHQVLLPLTLKDYILVHFCLLGQGLHKLQIFMLYILKTFIPEIKIKYHDNYRSSYTVCILINTPINNTYESCMGGALLESEKLPLQQNGAQNLYTKA